MKYNQIIKCDLKPYFGYESGYEDKDGLIRDVYLLTYDNCDKSLEIDVCSMFAFNYEFETLNREFVTNIFNLDDLISFMEKHGIHPDSLYFDKEYIYVGGGYDYILNHNMEVLGWSERLKETIEQSNSVDKYEL